MCGLMSVSLTLCHTDICWCTTLLVYVCVCANAGTAEERERESERERKRELRRNPACVVCVSKRDHKRDLLRQEYSCMLYVCVCVAACRMYVCV